MAYTYEDLAPRHQAGVIEIYNYYIANSFAAYGETAVGAGFYDHFLNLAKGYPAVAILEEAGAVVGFAFLHAHRPGAAFQRAAEITYFILPDHTGKGIGSAVLRQFIPAAQEQGIDTLLAHISSLNEASLRFHRKHGFQECGRFQRIGRKFGRDFDLIWMQRSL